jgi:2-keto-4-pentenoate hydratase/2-oxohepta-3-ene-1,7-dioic acid hydratase in catechol pathway
MKIICVGRNYTEHIDELQNQRPDSPVLFSKYDSSVFYCDKDFYIPDFSQEIHYEVEVLVKIEKTGKYIDQKYAASYYNKVGLGIDFTARDLQNQLKEKGLPWEKAKAFDQSALISRKWIDKSDLNLEDLNFSLLKNGESVQQGNTKLMLWKIDELISYISTYFTLKTGDIIFTGTPKGVGQVHQGDVLKGFLAEEKMFELFIK